MAGVTWTFAPEPTAPASTGVENTIDRLLRGADPSEALGFGLLRPFRRDLKQDFANSGGAKLVTAKVGQVLGTRAQSGRAGGELRWRPEFGSWVHLLRFMNNDAVLQELAKTYVIRALSRWVPVVRVREIRVDAQKSAITGDPRTALIHIRYDIATGPRSSQLALEDVSQTVSAVG